MSATDKKVFQNVLILSMTDLGTKGLTLLLMVLMARKFGPVLMGVLAFGSTVAAMLQILMDFGLTPFIQREVGRAPESAVSLISEVLSLKLVVSLLSSLLLLACIPFLAPDSPRREVTLILSAAMFFHSSTGAVCACFRALHMSQIEAIVRLSFRLSYTLVGLTALLTGCGLIALVSIELVIAIMAFLLALMWMGRLIGYPRGVLAWSHARGLVSKTWNFFLINIVQTIYNSIDLFMLSLMCGDLYAGYYTMACRLISSFDFLPSALAGGFLPILSREASERSSELIRNLRAYFRWNLLVGAGLGLGFAAFAEDMVPLLFGSKFVPAIPTLQLMGVATALTLVNWPLTTTIISLNQEQQILKMFTLGAAANILLNFLLLPVLKDQGAAWTTILSAILFILLQAKVLGPDLRRQCQLAQLGFGPLLTIVAGFLLVHWIRPLQLGLIANGMMAGVVFLLLALMTGSLKPEDFARAREYLAMRRRATAS